MKKQKSGKAGFKEESIEVKGMHCKSCSEKIENRLSNVKGIKNAMVSLADGKAYVRFDPKEINITTVKKEIGKAGYRTGADRASRGHIKSGIVYGLIPHIGCIAFIIGSILGVTVLTGLFRPLLMNPYFFHILIVISISFATLSSSLYLRKNGLLSSSGVKRKWKYLSTMYGSTVGINLLLFLLIFPLLANVSLATVTGAAAAPDTGGSGGISGSPIIRLQVDIPCSGHAPLITGELKTISGVSSVQFSFPNIFEVKYDSTKTSKEQILALEVFKTYKASVLGETATTAAQSAAPSTIGSSGQPASGGGCCGGGGSCGGSGGGCGGGCGGGVK